MPVFEHPEYRDHEQVMFCRDREHDLLAIIAIHSTAIGPAAGGCRMYPYSSTEQALADVLRLSQAMTVKNALAGIPLGGGKSVIIADASDPGKGERLRSFAAFVQRLNGLYWTAEDVGVSIRDAEFLAEHCDYIFGIGRAGQGSGDPSPFTALGVFQGIRAAVAYKLHRNSLSGIRVAVQGVGNVGYQVCRLLNEAGASLVVSDVEDEAVDRAVVEFGAQAVNSDSILAQDVEVISPCALGGTIELSCLQNLRARIIAGAANNQLATAEVGHALYAQGITFAPDFLINSGGMINASCDIFGNYDEKVVRRRIEQLYETTLELLARSDETGKSPEVVASETAARIIDEKISDRKSDSTVSGTATS